MKKFFRKSRRFRAKPVRVVPNHQAPEINPDHTVLRRASSRERFIMLFRILMMILGMVALIMAAPLIMAAVLKEKGMIRAFLIPMGAALATGLIALLLTKKQNIHLQSKDGFLLVFLTWVIMSLMGAIPYYLSSMDLSFTDSLFESSCGFATTGASTIADVESLPKSLMLWRGMTHWVGGMGIVVFTVALLPLLGVGGFQLVKAESPGPEKEKVTPKIADSAKILWFVYIGFTGILMLLLKFWGMDWFDALIQSFTIMASGGISTKNAGLAYYNSAAIDITCTIFMLLAATNFNLYYRMIKGKWKDIISNTEFRVFLGIFAATSLAISLALIPTYGSFLNALRYGSFHVASILSTTGNLTVNYELWPGFAKTILFGLMFIGGCSASTAGGIKVIRHVVLLKQAGNELRRIIFPRGIFSIHMNGKVGRKDVVYGVAGFIFLYGMVILATTLITAASGIDLFSSFCTALAMVGNVGTGFGAIGPNQTYAAFPDYLKWFYSFIMIAGRLELWTVFILFIPEYWRK